MVKQKNYRPEIDSLRAFSVLIVIFFHLEFKFFEGGFIGVDIFFVISGYLISKLILNEYNEKKFNLLNFYERRFRRIIPNLYFVITVSLILSIFILTPDKLISFSKSVIGNLLFFSNIIFWKEGGYFDLINSSKPLFHTWSLGVEEQFYFLFPIFTIIVLRLSFNIYFKLIIFFFMLSIIIMLTLNELKPNFSFYMLPTRGWEILLGVVLLLYEQSNLKKVNKITIKNILSFLGIFIIIFSVFFIDETFIVPGSILFIPLIGASLIILFCDKNTYLNKFFFK